VLVRLDTSKFIDLKDGYTEIQQTAVYIGDFEGQGNSSYMVLDDANNRLTLNNVNLATTQAESATVAVGTLAGKLAIRDASGTIIGYLPIYSTIT
jgi:translation elongation factor EF-4